MPNSPASIYELSQAGIPAAYTENLENLGYVSQPFASQEQVFQNQGRFQQLLKRILDTQMGLGQGGQNSFGGNTAMLPYSLRNMFSAAGGVLTDPMYGAQGASDFFGGGYKAGALPNNPSWAYDAWKNATTNYPNVPAPNPIAAPAQQNVMGGGGGGGGGTRQFTVALPGGGSMTVNANSAEAAKENAGQQGDVRVEQGGYRF